MLIFLALSIVLYMIQPVTAYLFILYIVLTKSFNFKIILLLIFILFTFRINLNLCQPIESGTIVELNHKSVIVNDNFTNVIIVVNDVSQYALRDKLIIYELEQLEFSPHLYGFNFANWSKSRNICYKATGQETFRIKGKGWLNWLSRGGFNRNPEFNMLFRSLIFQSNPEQELDLFISMGIMYLLIIKGIKLCLLKQKNHLYETIVVLLIFIILGYYLAWPLSLIRVLVFYLSAKYISNIQNKFSLNVIVCAFVNPFGLTQLAFALPLMIQFFAIFFPLKSKYIQRSIALILTLSLFNHSFSLLNVVIYPILFKLYQYLIIFSLSLTIFPIFNELYQFCVEMINLVYTYSLNIAVIRGNISILFILIYIALYHFLNHPIRDYIIMIYVIVGIKLLSIPFFYTVTMINIGQGDAFLIQAPFNATVGLIDTGPPSQENVLKTYLNAQSIDQIDYLIVTHDDSDHSGNLESLNEMYRIKQTIVKGQDIVDNGLIFKYLDIYQTSSDDNDASLVYTLDIIHTRFLFLGDLSQLGEKRLVSNYPHLNVDVLKVGHHGSKTSTSDDLLKHVQARIGLISVGFNDYGHPSYEVLERLDDYFISYFISRDDGDVKVVITPFFSYILNSNREISFF